LQSFIDFQFGTLPTSFNCPSGDTQELGCIVLRETFVIEQICNLLFVLGQLFDLFVKLCPASDVIRLLGSIMEFPAVIIGGLRIGVVIVVWFSVKWISV
jgi:hypothetical protein